MSADGKPLHAAARCSRFEHGVQFLDKRLGQPLLGTVDNEVDTAEMVRRLDNVVYTDAFALDADGIRLEGIARLFVRQSAAFDVVGVVGQVDLRLVVNAPFELHSLLLAQGNKQRRQFRAATFACRQSGIGGNVPCFSREERALDFPFGAIVTSRTLRNAVLLGECNY